MIREEYWLLWADVAIREAQASASANATVASQSAPTWEASRAVMGRGVQRESCRVVAVEV